ALGLRMDCYHPTHNPNPRNRRDRQNKTFSFHHSSLEMVSPCSWERGGMSKCFRLRSEGFLNQPLLRVVFYPCAPASQFDANVSTCTAAVLDRRDDVTTGQAPVRVFKSCRP